MIDDRLGPPMMRKMLPNPHRLGTPHEQVHAWSSACYAPPKCQKIKPSQVPVDAKNETLPLMSGWVKVTPETMPPNDDDVLTCNNFRARIVGSYSDGDWMFEWGTLSDVNQKRCLTRFTPIVITHWQPLPAPPTEEE